MPTIASDFFPPTIIPQTLHDSAQLPVDLEHTGVELDLTRRDFGERDQSDLESAGRSVLDSAPPRTTGRPRPIDTSAGSHSTLNSPLNAFYDPEDSQMSRRNKSSPKTGSDQPESIASGGKVNGFANGPSSSESMESHLEMRRKHPVLDSPTSESSRAHLMGRESFSLDNEIPDTPSTPNSSNTSFFDLPRQDRRNFMLLVLLYFLQGIPMGRSLEPETRATKKLDHAYTDMLRNRNDLPGGRAKEMLVAAGASDGSGVWSFTSWWFFLVFLCATQDIAVDGWALTLLSPPHLSYASTAQTVGLTAGHFLSYTVFLALNAPDFANRWFRKTPSAEGVMTLGGYLTFWGWAYLAVTLGLAVLKREEKTKDRDGILEVYKSMLGVLKLKNIQSIIIIHLIAKLGFQANDAVTNLKLLDKGFSQEDLALTVLIDFPFEISLGYYAGRWSTTNPPIHVWCWAFIGRLIAACVAQGVVMIFPANGVQPWYLLTVIASHIFSTFSSTVMFVAISAFHAKIADPVIGGTYMTLLATVSNLGGTFPRFFILKLVDYFTQATCTPPADVKKPLSLPASCVTESDQKQCKDGGGTCVIDRDGYYITNIVCVAVGIVTFLFYIRPAAMRLQALPLRAWRLAAGERN
ncbi:uncharacterized protein KY384_000981 [Bacidia gigantensis]|uniref:uncharacterized protein n=1 Tax=Bacidia gigantensis TaxID=2732470 RepID=UPI001D042006|nr:uncharacterized protein KY384_000981 [Bacidia gigantensis]KAG8534137.1 hypothetical protein KY384_000981 [Bacidia gigantensis]